MKRIFFLLMLFLLGGLAAYCQNDSLKAGEKNPSLVRENPDSIVHHRVGWKTVGQVGITFAQTAYTNWASGGQNSISGTALFNALSVYKNGARITFENKLDLVYGRVQIGPENRKSDDKIDFTSKYGRTIGDSKWSYSLQMNFKSQFDHGYNYPNDSVLISKFMAPGYFLYAFGLEYKPAETFAFFISPLSGKTTVVNDRALADSGAFGVDRAILDTAGNVVTSGKRIRHEFGGSLNLDISQDIGKNIKLNTSLKMFSNYLDKPGNIDVNWTTTFLFKINKFFSCNVGTELIYDDDVAVPVDRDGDGVKESSGPRLQFKEVLSLEFAFKF